MKLRGMAYEPLAKRLHCIAYWGYHIRSSCRGTNDASPHHPDPSSPPPLAHLRSTASFLPTRPSFQLHIPVSIVAVVTSEITHPTLSLHLDFDSLHHPFLYPFPTSEIENPFLVFPFPALGREHVLKESGSSRSISRNTLRRQRVVWRRAEDPVFPLPASTSLPSLQLKDFHLARFRGCVKYNVMSDPSV